MLVFSPCALSIFLVTGLGSMIINQLLCHRCSSRFSRISDLLLGTPVVQYATETMKTQPMQKPCIEINHSTRKGEHRTKIFPTNKCLFRSEKNDKMTVQNKSIQAEATGHHPIRNFQWAILSFPAIPHHWILSRDTVCYGVSSLSTKQNQETTGSTPSRINKCAAFIFSGIRLKSECIRRCTKQV